MRILLVEDDIDLAQFIRKGLKEERYALDVAADGDAGLDLAMHNPYALFILDISGPNWMASHCAAGCAPTGKWPAARQVWRDGKEIVLANKEYALLEFLLRNKTGCRRARRLLTMCGTSVMTRSVLWMHTSGRFEPRSTVAFLLSSS